MLEFAGRKIPNDLSEIVASGCTVLLVWDMQNDQAGGSFNKEALIRNVPPLIAAAATAGVKTVYTRQTPFLWQDESSACDYALAPGSPAIETSFSWLSSSSRFA